MSIASSRKLLIGILCCCARGWAQSPATTRSSEDLEIDHAYSLYADGTKLTMYKRFDEGQQKIADATAALRLSATDHPDSIRFHLALAGCIDALANVRLQAGNGLNLEEVIRLDQEAVQIEGQFPDDTQNKFALTRLGFCYFRLAQGLIVKESDGSLKIPPPAQADLEQAAGYLEHAVILDSLAKPSLMHPCFGTLPGGSSEVHYDMSPETLGNVYEYLMLPDEALAEYRYALTITPDKSRIYLSIANLQSRRQHTEDALQALVESVVANNQPGQVFDDIDALYQKLHPGQSPLKHDDRGRVGLDTSIPAVAEIATLAYRDVIRLAVAGGFPNFAKTTRDHALRDGLPANLFDPLLDEKTPRPALPEPHYYKPSE